jgi:NitT/TauT family transport system substrate-binding protein
MRKTRRHPNVWFRAAACCAALLAAFSGMHSTVLGQTHDSGGSLRTVTMLLPGQGGSATGIIWYGVDEGIFKKHGIDLQIETPGAVAGASSLPLLDAGRFDVGYASSITMLKDRQENASQLVQFYGLFQSNPNCFFVRKSAGMKSLGELKGKTIILASSTDNSAMIAMLAKHGVTQTTAKIEYAATSAQFGAFIQGTADAISTYGYLNQPLLRAVNDLDTTTFCQADDGYNFLWAGLVARSDYLAANRATIKALAAAIGETYASAAQNPRVAAASLQRHYPEYTSPVDLTAEIIRLQVPWMTTPNTRKLPLGKMSAADWDTTKQMGVKYFGIHPDLDIASAWTNAAFDVK